MFNLFLRRTMTHPNTRMHGFSLIEMALVLTIIALLVGGVLVGQSMIRSSQVNSIMSEKEKLASGINQFKEKYASMPGDLPNAGEYWGLLSGTPGTCYNMAPSALTATCNGTGNGRVWPLNDAETATSKFESFRAWQHLSNAKMVEKSFTGRDEDGTTNDASSSYVPDVNVPGSRIEGGYFILRDLGKGYDASDAATTNYFNTGYFHSLTHSNVISSDEAYNIDKKFDDGRPAHGNIKEMKRNAGASLTCTTTAVEATAEYARTTSDFCTLILLLGY